jgi:hypothetical protein
LIAVAILVALAGVVVWCVLRDHELEDYRPFDWERDG